MPVVHTIAASNRTTARMLARIRMAAVIRIRKAGKATCARTCRYPHFGGKVPDRT